MMKKNYLCGVLKIDGKSNGGEGLGRWKGIG